MYWLPVENFLTKSVVPLLAMVPRLTISSLAVMPMPVSWIVMVSSSVFTSTEILNSSLSPRMLGSFRAMNRILSLASDALEISSRMKISLLV